MFCVDTTGQAGTTWLQARQACANQGMHLVWINSAEEDAFIAQTLVDLGGNTTWIGADDLSVEGSWVWDGSVQFWQGGPAPSGYAVDGRYSNWRPAQPNNLNNVEQCVISNAANTGTLSYSWDDIACDLKMFAFVCEDH